MSEILDSGERTAFNSGAVRDMHDGKGRFDLLPMCVLLRLAKHYENGARKYGERNWEKGIPTHSYLDSAFRHLVKYADGWDDEDHLIAAIWNLCGLAWTEEKHPELMDMPKDEKKRSCNNCKWNREDFADAPTVVPDTNVGGKGKWIKFSEDDEHRYRCSECGVSYNYPYYVFEDYEEDAHLDDTHFCSNCGARNIRGGE